MEVGQYVVKQFLIPRIETPVRIHRTLQVGQLTHDYYAPVNVKPQEGGGEHPGRFDIFAYFYVKCFTQGENIDVKCPSLVLNFVWFKDDENYNKIYY